MGDPLIITYCFDFDSGRAITYQVYLDRDTLNLLNGDVQEVPAWTEISYKQCRICPLSKNDTRTCPVAQNLVHVTKKFSNVVSHETVSISVTTQDRTYKKRTTIDEGLSSLMGVIMVTSGCPVMDYLKPMARFHLPFASPEETTIRTLSMYLMAQYFLKGNTDSIHVKLEELNKIYSQISVVNNDFSSRLAEAGEKDANLSALSNLDCHATLVTMTIEETLAEFRQYYSAYV